MIPMMWNFSFNLWWYFLFKKEITTQTRKRVEWSVGFSKPNIHLKWLETLINFPVGVYYYRYVMNTDFSILLQMLYIIISSQLIWYGVACSHIGKGTVYNEVSYLQLNFWLGNGASLRLSRPSKSFLIFVTL